MSRTGIVICQDETVFAASEFALAKAGYTVVRATALAEPLKRLLALEPELIVLDLDLPHHGATDILHWLGNQQSRPGLVLLSSGENLRLLREGFVVPDFQLLIKPLGQDEMSQAVSRTLHPGQRHSANGNQEA